MKKQGFPLMGVILWTALAFLSLSWAGSLESIAEAQETTVTYEKGSVAGTNISDAEVFKVASAAEMKAPVAKKGEFPVCWAIRWNGNYWHRSELTVKNAENLRRYIALLKKYGLKSDFLFMGLATYELNDFAPDVIRMIKEFNGPIGHHGANRDPKPQPHERIVNKSWEDAVRTYLDYETHAIDPQTGELDYTRLGGIAGMEPIFGKPMIWTGRNPWGPMLYVLKQFGVRLCIGLPGQHSDIDQGHFWYMGVLNMPERHVKGISLRTDFREWVDTGKSPLKETEKAVEALDRSTYVQIRVQPLGHDNDLLTRDDFSGEKAKAMPADVQEKTWKCLEETFAFLASHKEWVNVTVDDILSFAKDDRNRQVTPEMLDKAVGQLTPTSAVLPDYIAVGDDDVLSLADTFQALLSSLAHYAKQNSFPKSVDVKDIMGPTRLRTALNVAIPVDKQDILKTVIAVADELKDRIPDHVTFTDSGTEVNPAEFLVAMARLYDNLRRRTDAKSVLVDKVNAIPKKALTLPVWVPGDEAVISSPQLNNIDNLSRLQYWTLKPVRWDRDQVMKRAEAARRARG